MNYTSQNPPLCYPSSSTNDDPNMTLSMETENAVPVFREPIYPSSSSMTGASSAGSTVDCYSGVATPSSVPSQVQTPSEFALSSLQTLVSSSSYPETPDGYTPPPSGHCLNPHLDIQQPYTSSSQDPDGYPTELQSNSGSSTCGSFGSNASSSDGWLHTPPCGTGHAAEYYPQGQVNSTHNASYYGFGEQNPGSFTSSTFRNQDESYAGSQAYNDTLYIFNLWVAQQPEESRLNAAHHPTPEDNQVHQCDMCGKSFKRSQELRRHARTVHNDARPFSCQKCTKPFNRKDILSRHERTCTYPEP